MWHLGLKNRLPSSNMTGGPSGRAYDKNQGSFL
jgi:hypothetical protein